MRPPRWRSGPVRAVACPISLAPWLHGRRHAVTEVPLDRLLPIREDARELAPHQRVCEATGPSEGQRVADRVLDHGLASLFAEPVRVDPERVWTAQLDVGELVRRLPAGDLRAPSERNAV